MNPKLPERVFDKRPPNPSLDAISQGDPGATSTPAFVDPRILGLGWSIDPGRERRKKGTVPPPRWPGGETPIEPVRQNKELIRKA